MNAIATLTWFIPEWAYPWLIVGAIGAWIIGANRLAIALTVLVLLDLVLAPLIAPWLEEQPAWVLALLLIIVALMILNGVISLLFGKEAGGHVVGTYVVRILDLLIRGPFRVVRRLFRGLMSDS